MIILIAIMAAMLLLIAYAMVGYPLFLVILEKIKKPAECKHNYNYTPDISYMIVAHNEEKSIKAKLENILTFNYPLDKIQILVASDNSTDSTNDLVREFAVAHPELNVVLHITEEHKGKTNAQNEASKKATGEILVMTDANTMLDKDAITELVTSFTDEKIAYVCGKLVYTNTADSASSESESAYWSLDLKMRDIESKIQTITAGNGALYACRTKEYVDVNPIFCHDLTMPYIYAKKKKRALFCPTAVVYEKAGESNKDEFKRKVRMNRDLITSIVNGFKVLNIFKYKWFSVFYFGHRTCRYLLWLYHLCFFAASVALICFLPIHGIVLSAAQVFWILISAIAIKKDIGFAPLRLLSYYGIAVLAQYVGVYRIITGKAKPVWEKAASTR